MHYVQLVLTESQAALTARALSNSVVDNDDPTEREQLTQLADFFYAVEANPAAFPVKTPAMTRAIKKRVSRMKGAPTSRKPNVRKRTQERKQGFQKRTRWERREEVAAHNSAFEAAQARLEAEREHRNSPSERIKAALTLRKA